MPRGGKRPGAGRKPGQLNKRTIARQQLASSAASEGISPLEVMLKRMRYYDSVVDRELEKGEGADRGIIDDALKAANDAAKDAAPYLHPRLSAVEHTDNSDGGLAEILKLCAESTRGLPDPAKIPPDRPPQEAPEPPSPSPTPPPAGPTPSRLETPSWSKSLLPEPQSYDWVGQRRR